MTAYTIGYNKERYDNDNPTVYGQLLPIIEACKSKYRIAEYGVGENGYRYDSTTQQQIGIRRPEVFFTTSMTGNSAATTRYTGTNHRALNS